MTDKYTKLKLQRYFLAPKNRNNEYIKDIQYRMQYKKETIDTRARKEKQNLQTYTAIEQTKHQEK